MKFYVCETCGNFVQMIRESGAPMSCCGKNMIERIPGTSDGAADKHVPVFKIDGQKVSVNVGSVNHPMAQVHYIEWIAIETEKGMQRTELVPGQAPSADFLLTEGDRVKAVYAYCNLHKLWKAEA